MRTLRTDRGRGFTLVELLVAVAIIGILASMAISNFQKFTVRARQSEAKSNLKSYYIAAKANLAEYGTFVCNTCGWLVESGYVYNYYLSSTASGRITDGSGGCAEAAGGVTAAAQSINVFTASAVGNIDGDSICDGWNIDDSNALTNPSNDVEL